MSVGLGPAEWSGVALRHCPLIGHDRADRGSEDASGATVLAVDVPRLLNDLCVRLGYCLPPDDQQRIIDNPPISVDAFTDAVVVAEGLDPVLMATEQRQEIRRIVAAAFGEPFGPSGRTWRPR